MQLNHRFNLQDFISRQAYFDLFKLVRICTYIEEATRQKVVINNWAAGGKLERRGLRLPYDSVGSTTSEHRNFRAVDVNIGNWTGKRMFEWVSEHAARLYELGVRRVEHPDYTPTWLHLDCREHGKKAIQIISPSKVLDEIKIV